MPFPMEAKHVDPLNEELSQFYVIVAFTRRPSVVLFIHGVSDWNLATAHKIVACHLCRPPTYPSELPLQYSALYQLHHLTHRQGSSCCLQAVLTGD